MITNPATGETLAIAQWARRIGINTNSFADRIKRWGIENPRTFAPGRHPPSLLVNPQTGESMSPKEWAVALGITPCGMLRRIKKWGCNDPRTFRPGVLIRGQKTYTNPETGESLSVEDWAKRLEVSVARLYCRFSQLGLDHPDTFRPALKFSCTNPATEETLTISEWAKRLDLSYSAFRLRLKRYGANDPRTFTPNSLRRRRTSGGAITYAHCRQEIRDRIARGELRVQTGRRFA